MKAPDKIYIHEASAPELAEPVLKEYHIEYIRKDALLEWAKNEKSETEALIKKHPEDDSLFSEMHWYERLIEKINTL